MRVLVVDDDADLRTAISDSLRAAGIEADTAADLPDAGPALAATRYDCVVIARSLPGGDALAYVEDRRATGWTVPVLLLTARELHEDRADALRTADDLLVKPFAMAELVSRVRSLGRSTAIDAPRVLRVGGLEVDLERHEARRGGVPITLTAREIAVLEMLVTRLGQPVSRAELASHAWDDWSGPRSTMLDVTINQLRRKLGPPTLIQAIRGAGYQLTVDSGVTFPVTIYLSDESVHRQVQEAVEELLNQAGAEVVDRDEPVLGSWFRRMRARVRAATSPAAREAAAVAAHALDSRLVLAQDAAVTATMMQNLGPVLGSLQPTKDAVIRAGALLIVKVEWTVAVHQLTAAQQLLLDHQPQLLTSPHDILVALHQDADSAAAASAACASPVTQARNSMHDPQLPHTSHNADRSTERDPPTGPSPTWP
jgi:two-component system OmpR family response regulator